MELGGSIPWQSPPPKKEQPKPEPQQAPNEQIPQAESIPPTPLSLEPQPEPVPQPVSEPPPATVETHMETPKESQQELPQESPRRLAHINEVNARHLAKIKAMRERQAQWLKDALAVVDKLPNSEGIKARLLKAQLKMERHRTVYIHPRDMSKLTPLVGWPTPFRTRSVPHGWE